MILRSYSSLSGPPVAATAVTGVTSEWSPFWRHWPSSVVIIFSEEDEIVSSTYPDNTATETMLFEKKKRTETPSADTFVDFGVLHLCETLHIELWAKSLMIIEEEANGETEKADKRTSIEPDIQLSIFSPFASALGVSVVASVGIAEYVRRSGSTPSCICFSVRALERALNRNAVMGKICWLSYARFTFSTYAALNIEFTIDTHLATDGINRGCWNASAIAAVPTT